MRVQQALALGFVDGRCACVVVLLARARLEGGARGVDWWRAAVRALRGALRSALASLSAWSVTLQRGAQVWRSSWRAWARRGGRAVQEGGGGGASPQAFGDPPRAPGSSPGGYWGPGQHRRGGGGGASPQAFGDPPRRRAPHQEVIGARASTGGGGGGASPQAFGDPPRRRAPHQEVIGARASVCARASPQAFGPALSGGARRGAVQAGSPRGWLSCAWPQAS